MRQTGIFLAGEEAKGGLRLCVGDEGAKPCNFELKVEQLKRWIAFLPRYGYQWSV
jgi:hypothetical protein